STSNPRYARNMSKLKKKIISVALILLIIPAIFLTNCRKTENPIKFESGIFPDSVYNLTGINSAYDDYNMALFELQDMLPAIFSSNRGSNGGQFDLVQGLILLTFNQTTGIFNISSEMGTNAYLAKLISTVTTPGNDFGPYSFFSPADGNEYLILSSLNAAGNLDFFYTKNQPAFGQSVPQIDGPYPAKLLNSGSDEAYISLDANQDTAYFCSNQEGNFDIYFHEIPEDITIDSWLNGDYEPSSKAGPLNSTADDKCPFVYRKVMVFASNRDGGFGGYDLYYSEYSNGTWGAPINFGPLINSASDEYRPVIGGLEDYSNNFLIFSSNRPGGAGGYDLYFTGTEIVR
ncbi:MAG: hypothetical protein WCE64_14540, partial [Bacteroidales bacterium]